MKKLLLLLFLILLPCISFADITYFNSSSSPTDGGVLGAQTQSVTPPSSMVSGDLVVMTSVVRTGGTLTISATGGQSWNTLNGLDDGTIGHRVFWCQYNGTWSADPSVVSSVDPGSHSVIMHVFRPTSGSNTWAVDNASSSTSYSAPSTPFTVSRSGVTTTQASTVTFALMTSRDDNTWGNISGSGWVVTGGAQYRNAFDTSSTYAHYIQTSAGATGTVTKDQLTNGGDAGTTSRVSFYEASAATATPTNTPTQTPTATPTNTPTPSAILIDMIQPMGVIAVPR